MFDFLYTSFTHPISHASNKNRPNNFAVFALFYEKCWITIFIFCSIVNLHYVQVSTQLVSIENRAANPNDVMEFEFVPETVDLGRVVKDFQVSQLRGIFIAETRPYNVKYILCNRSWNLHIAYGFLMTKYCVFMCYDFVSELIIQVMFSQADKWHF